MKNTYPDTQENWAEYISLVSPFKATKTYRGESYVRER